MRLTPKTPTMLDKRVSLISNLDMCSELHLLTLCWLQSIQQVNNNNKSKARRYEFPQFVINSLHHYLWFQNWNFDCVAVAGEDNGYKLPSFDKAQWNFQSLL